MSENWKLSDEDVQVPLGVGDEGAAARETSYEAPRKSSVNAATLALVGVFLASLAMIYVLGLQNRPRSASAQVSTLQTDSAIAELLNKAGKSGEIKSVFQNTDQLVQMFYNYPGHSAAEWTQLPGNPFEVQGKAPPTTCAGMLPPQSTGASLALLAEQERTRKLADSFAQLKLQSVMVSKSMSAAMINGKLVSVGGKVGEFTVNEITAEHVILTAGDNKFELKQQRTNPNTD